MNKRNYIKLFSDDEVRSIWLEEEKEWYYAIEDIIKLYGERSYDIYYINLKKRLRKQGYYLEKNCIIRKLLNTEKKWKNTRLIDTQTAFRLLEEIASKKLKKYKDWMAKIATERLEEIGDPEKIIQRAKKLYEEKGYPKEWEKEKIRELKEIITDKELK